MAKSTGLKYGPLSYIVSEPSPRSPDRVSVLLRLAGPFSAHLFNPRLARLHGGGGVDVVGDGRGDVLCGSRSSNVNNLQDMASNDLKESAQNAARATLYVNSGD